MFLMQTRLRFQYTGSGRDELFSMLSETLAKAAKVQHAISKQDNVWSPHLNRSGFIGKSGEELKFLVEDLRGSESE